MSMHSAVCPVQVGRDAEVETLARLCAQRTASLIGGEAGVGKSRLAAEALRLAAERGMVALVGHCTPEGTLPYAPFATALRRRTRTMERAELDGLFADAAFLSAALLPEVARAVGVPTEAPDQADLFAGVWQVLARLAGGAGAVLVLEDLHWADVDSLRLLSYLVREAEGLPVWIVGTYRVDELHRRHPLTAVLGELTRERLVEEIRLAPLSREQLRSMVSAIFDGTEVGDEFVDALLQRTDGNPFFVEELIKVLLERGDIYRERDAWERREVTEIEMPESVRDTLLARVRGLDEATLDFLRLAAISGERLDLAVLARATGSDDAKVDDILREGLRLQILVERRDDPRTPYAFRHALTREALADELVGPDRQHAHQRVADALADIHRNDLDAVSTSLADHYTEAGDSERAIEFGVRAARRAAASFATEEAGRLFDRALRLIPGSSTGRLATLLEAAEALSDAPDRRLAVAFATQAREIAHRTGDTVAEVRAMEVLKNDAWLSGDSPRALTYLEESRELVRGVDDALEAMVLARLTRLMCLVDRHDLAAPIITEGIALAESSRNYRALSILYGSRLMTAPFGPEFNDAMERSLAAARAAHDPRTECNLLVNAGFIMMWTGDLERSRTFLRQAADGYAAHLPYDRYAEAGLAWTLSLRGEYAEAEGLAAPLRVHASVPTRIVALTALCEVAERQGDPSVDQLVDELHTLAVRSGEAQRSVPALAAVARRVLARQGVDAALPRFWEVIGATTNSRGLGSHWMFSPELAAALASEARATELAEWHDAIGALSQRDPNDQNLAAFELVDARRRALSGDIDGARRAFNEAARRFGVIRYPAREAEALLGLADLEWAADRPEASATAADSALEVARACRAGRLEDEAQRALARSRAPSVLATVLFTDIVSSTERLREMGDHAWNAVLERHNSVVRRELERFDGREVKTTGDGFLASFDRPAHAIRCALAVRDALAASGLDVRAGMHTGECQLVGDDLVGITVHVGARVSSAAGPGQVLVSSTVRDLVAGSSLAFADRGLHELKGIPGEWRLFEALSS